MKTGKHRRLTVLAACIIVLAMIAGGMYYSGFVPYMEPAAGHREVGDGGGW